MTVRITTGEKCRDMSRVQTVVGPTPQVTESRFEGRFTTAASDECDPSGFVGTLVITPGGTAGSIVVAAGVRVGDAPPPNGVDCTDRETAKRCIIARRSFAFVEHESLTLPIHLDPLCVGRTCDATSTCFRGACVASTVRCDGDNCGLPEEGFGAGGDGGSSDGAYDADLDGIAFEDVRDAGGDGAQIVDGSGDGSLGPPPPCSMFGGGGSPMSGFCSPYNNNGELTDGGCNGELSMKCCRCRCPNQAVTSCTSMSGCTISCP